jgi:sulfoxide reductase heme-binding subunit YedZ
VASADHVEEFAMSVRYSPVKWNANKRTYDLILLGCIVGYVGVFFAVGKVIWPGSDEILLLRALGTCAFLLFHVVLAIGPLARLDRRFLPVLYNRRHLGVATFAVGLAHGALATGYYHGFGNASPLVSLLGTNTAYGSWSRFPFETLGIVALLILFLMAATSHDFWQKNLGPSVWKNLHMLAYLAYALLVLHVALGALQAEGRWPYALILGAGLGTIAGLHLAVAWRERSRDRISISADEWIDAGMPTEIEEGRAKIVCGHGERIAVWRHGGKISATTNVCAHQRGPLGEGKMIDGCITCPWHGWEYRPETGQSPPPFHEKIPTHLVKLERGRILVHREALPAGTPVDPISFEEPADVARCRFQDAA